MTYKELCEKQVAWYRVHGNYPDRVVRDSKGIEYVIGDASWNSNRTKIEYIEQSQGFQALTTTAKRGELQE